jgi:D-alanine-D-alanine ligase
MTRVLLLAGGNSDEREVSLRSGASVKAALIKAGYEVKEFDPAQPLTKTEVEGCDVVFPVLHGAGGEDGTLQAQLDKFGTPYVGTGTAASELCFDKWRYKELLIENGLPTPRGELVNEAGFWESKLIKNPFVLKPYDGGSSVDTLIMRDGRPEPNHATVAELFKKHSELLLEELIEGTEITLPVLGQEALPVIEIIPPPSGEFDYENKYNGKSQELCPPLHVAQDIQAKAQDMAVRIHKLTNCRDFSRTDIMIDTADNLFVLETNTIPGMTDQSLFPKAAQVSGISMEQLVDKLVRLALAR